MSVSLYIDTDIHTYLIDNSQRMTQHFTIFTEGFALERDLRFLRHQFLEYFLTTARQPAGQNDNASRETNTAWYRRHLPVQLRHQFILQVFSEGVDEEVHDRLGHQVAEVFLHHGVGGGNETRRIRRPRLTNLDNAEVRVDESLDDLRLVSKHTRHLARQKTETDKQRDTHTSRS